MSPSAATLTRHRPAAVIIGADTQPAYLTKREAAEYARVSVRTISRAIKRGDLRRGRASPSLVRIRPEWVDEWLERGRRCRIPETHSSRG